MRCSRSPEARSHSHNGQELDPELANFCRRFNLDPQVPDFEDDTPGTEGLDADLDGPDITKQSDLDRFSAVLHCAQQVAIQLEIEKLESRKRKTPRQYTGNSLRTLQRHKRSRLQLAEKGYHGVFDYIDLQKHRTAARASNKVASNLEKGPSAKEQPIPEEEEEESADDGGSIEVYCVIEANQCGSGVEECGGSGGGGIENGAEAAPNTAAAAHNAAAATPNVAAATPNAAAAAPNTATTAPPNAAAMAVPNAVLVAPDTATTAPPNVAATAAPNEAAWELDLMGGGLQGPAWTDNSSAQGAGNNSGDDTLPDIVERRSDQNKDVSENESDKEKDYTSGPIHAEARRAVDMMLEERRQWNAETNTGLAWGPISAADEALDLWNDRVALGIACAKLKERCKPKTLDVIVRARITAMIGVLNLFLEAGLGYTWRNASIVVAKAQGQGTTHACNLRKWILNFIRYEELPVHCYNQSRWTVLEDEDISRSLQIRLGECAKRGYIKAADVVAIVESPEMQANLKRVGVCRPTITERTARNWLKRLDWRFEPKKNGMYIDGHEREDVVRYRNAFVARWKEYEKRFHKWNNDGNPLPLPTGFPVAGGRFRLILITHDESTFFQNDERKTHWAHSSATATPKPKGNGQLLMVSDFLTVEWGRLVHGTEYVFFPPLLPSCHISLLQTHTAKPGSYSRPEKIERVTLVPTNSSSKLIMPSTFSRQTQGGPKASSCSTTHQVIKNEPAMRYQLGGW